MCDWSKWVDFMLGNCGGSREKWEGLAKDAEEQGYVNLKHYHEIKYG